MKTAWVVAMLMLTVKPSIAQQEWQKAWVPVCGKILVTQGKRTTAWKNQQIRVYKAKNKDDVVCCERAEEVLGVKTDRYGKFLVRKLDEGNYFLVLDNTKPLLAIPILVPEAYQSKNCDMDQRFTIDATTGKSEVSAIIQVD